MALYGVFKRAGWRAVHNRLELCTTLFLSVPYRQRNVSRSLASDCVEGKTVHIYLKFTLVDEKVFLSWSGNNMRKIHMVLCTSDISQSRDTTYALTNKVNCALSSEHCSLYGKSGSDWHLLTLCLFLCTWLSQYLICHRIAVLSIVKVVVCLKLLSPIWFNCLGTGTVPLEQAVCMQIRAELRTSSHQGKQSFDLSLFSLIFFEKIDSWSSEDNHNELQFLIFVQRKK